MLRRPIQAAALAGGLSAVAVCFVQSLLHIGSREPAMLAIAGGMLGLRGLPAVAGGTMLAALAGGVGGLAFAASGERVEPRGGLRFAIVPWLFVMFVVLPLNGQPMFAGGDAGGLISSLLASLTWGWLVGVLAPHLAWRLRVRRRVRRNSPRLAPRPGVRLA